MRQDIQTNLEDSQNKILDLLSTDLDVALTFCQIAADAKNPEKRGRNLQNARKAYQSTIGWLKKLNLHPAPDLEQKLQRLRQALHEAGAKL